MPNSRWVNKEIMAYMCIGLSCEKRWSLVICPNLDGAEGHQCYVNWVRKKKTHTGWPCSSAQDTVRGRQILMETKFRDTVNRTELRRPRGDENRCHLWLKVPTPVVCIGQKICEYKTVVSVLLWAVVVKLDSEKIKLKNKLWFWSILWIGST